MIEVLFGDDVCTVLRLFLKTIKSGLYFTAFCQMTFRQGQSSFFGAGCPGQDDASLNHADVETTDSGRQTFGKLRPVVSLVIATFF